MAENFKFELVKPDQFVFSSEVSSVKIPCYEGEMTTFLEIIFPLITFLRPGIVEIDKQEIWKILYRGRTVEFNNNNLSSYIYSRKISGTR